MKVVNYSINTLYVLKMTMVGSKLETPNTVATVPTVATVVLPVYSTVPGY